MGRHFEDGETHHPVQMVTELQSAKSKKPLDLTRFDWNRAQHADLRDKRVIKGPCAGHYRPRGFWQRKPHGHERSRLVGDVLNVVYACSTSPLGRPRQCIGRQVRWGEMSATSLPTHPPTRSHQLSWKLKRLDWMQPRSQL